MFEHLFPVLGWTFEYEIPDALTVLCRSNIFGTWHFWGYISINLTNGIQALFPRQRCRC
jgi:hypothetical protein